MITHGIYVYISIDPQNVLYFYFWCVFIQDRLSLIDESDMKREGPI